MKVIGVTVVLILLFGVVEALASSSASSSPLSTATSTNQRQPIVVVGAGLAGLSVAIGAADLGLDVEVLESRSSFARQAGATFGLQPCGLKALQELCPEALDPITRQGLFLQMSGGYMLPWYVVRDALLEQLDKRKDHIKLHMGATVVDIDDTTTTTSSSSCDTSTSCVNIRYSDKDGTTHDVQACLLVGCDGVHSQIRTHLGLPRSERVQNLWRGTVDIPTTTNNDNDNEAKYGQAAALLDQGIVPLGAKKYGPFSVSVFNFHESMPNTMAWTINGDFPALSDDESHDVWELLEPHMDDSDENKEVIRQVLSLATDSDRGTVLEYSTINPRAAGALPKGWGGSGRIALSGDAAHCLRPATGLGGSMAFEDSVVLCREMATMAAGGSSSSVSPLDESIVTKFEASRLDRVLRVWDDEWSRAEYFRENGVMKPRNEEYSQWLDAGIPK